MHSRVTFLVLNHQVGASNFIAIIKKRLASTRRRTRNYLCAWRESPALLYWALAGVVLKVFSIF